MTLTPLTVAARIAEGRHSNCFSKGKLFMLYQEFPPHPSLKSRIRCYWTLTLSETVHRGEDLHFLAEGLELSFNLGDRIQLVTGDPEPRTAGVSCVCGPMTQPMRIRPTGQLELFGVCFRPGGAYPFFSYPARELVDGFGELEELWGSRVSSIVETIQSKYLGTRERIDLLDRLFLLRLEKHRTVDCCVGEAVNAIESKKGQVNVEALARMVGLSSRQLERRFKERVGMSPKQLSRSVRFKAVFRHFAASVPDSCAATALACGYYDQSHMIHDFKHYTGMAPMTYFAEPNAVNRFFTGNF